MRLNEIESQGNVIITSNKRIEPYLTALKPCLGRSNFPPVKTGGYDVFCA